MVEQNFRNILPHMTVFMSQTEEHLTFINTMYAIEIVGNTDKINVYIPTSDRQGETLLFTYKFSTRKKVQHCYMLDEVCQMIDDDVTRLIKALEVLK
jgi:hypothetical protein